MSDDEAYIAPPGFVWVCLACGKVSQDRRGSRDGTSRGWDVSCFLNSEKFERSKLVWNDDNSRVVRVND